MGCLIPEDFSPGPRVSNSAVASRCCAAKIAGSSVAGTGNFSSSGGAGDVVPDRSISHCLAIFFSTNKILNTTSTPINPNAIVKTA